MQLPGLSKEGLDYAHSLSLSLFGNIMDTSETSHKMKWGQRSGYQMAWLHLGMLLPTTTTGPSEAGGQGVNCPPPHFYEKCGKISQS